MNGKANKTEEYSPWHSAVCFKMGPELTPECSKWNRVYPQNYWSQGFYGNHVFMMVLIMLLSAESGSVKWIGRLEPSLQ